MKWTVAICTWNGDQRIGDTLKTFLKLKTEYLKWELVIVDNNSTDQTASICQSFANELPLRIVRETKQGHSHSRNRAIRESQGEYIAWTDDDVRVDPHWLIAYDLAVDQTPEADFWGGRIIPRFDYPKPQWLISNWEVCGGVYAERDLGDELFEIRRIEQLPYGANFVTRRTVQKQFPFNEKFGRVGDVGVRGYDEIDVLAQMLDQGHRGVWVPDAKLEHVIPRERASLKYVARYFFGQGETWAERGISIEDIRDLDRQMQQHLLGYWLKRPFGSQRWFPHLVQLNNLRGQRSVRCGQSDRHD